MSSLFFLGSVTHTKKGDKDNEINANRLQDSPLEGARWPTLANYRPFRGYGAGGTLREQAIGPRFPHNPDDRPHQSGTGNTVGVGRGEDRLKPQRQRPLAPCVVFIPGPRPYLIRKMYWLENLMIEEEATWEEAA